MPMLPTRALGPGAPAVSAIGFGGMPLSTAGRPLDEDGVRVIHRVLDAGVTLLDTADVYCIDHRDIGHSERLMTRALKTWSGPRDQIIVATKGGMTRPDGRWERNGTPEHLRMACDRSLKALGVDRIDLYQFHAPDANVHFPDSVATLAELRQAGKIRWVGLSNVSVEQIKTAAAIVPILSVQNRLSPFFREAVETGVVQHCAQAGLGFLAYSPVGGGRLNKKLPAHPALKPIAERHGVSPFQVVLAWVLSLGSTVIPIPGGRTVEHALDSIAAAGLTLSSEELATIERAEFSRA